MTADSLILGLIKEMARQPDVRKNETRMGLGLAVR